MLCACELAQNRALFLGLLHTTSFSLHAPPLFPREPPSSKCQSGWFHL